MHFEDLLGAISADKQSKIDIANDCLSSLRLSMLLLSTYYEAADRRSPELFNGAYGSAVESVSLLALGLLRPAALSLRSFYEASLQYIYYKDHLVEWSTVKDFRSNLVLPEIVKKYLKGNFPFFELRMKELTARKTREHEDCYQVLSGVAHGSALHSLSIAEVPKDVIQNSSVLVQAVGLFNSVDESLVDIFVGKFSGNWLSLNTEVRLAIQARFGTSSAATLLNM